MKRARPALAPRLLASLLLALLPFPGQAQQPPAKVPLAFTADAPDDIGARLAHLVRERLRRSSSVTFTPDKSAAWLWVHLMSIRMEGSAVTSYSLVAGLNDGGAWSGASYWSSQVGNCGSAVTDRCAANVLAFIDQAVSEFQTENARRTASKP